MSKTDKYYTLVGDRLIEVGARDAADAGDVVIHEQMGTLDVMSASVQESSPMDKSTPFTHPPDDYVPPTENPKAVQANKEGKQPLEFIPMGTLEGAANVLEHGAKKYGKRNWRLTPIKASTYQGAFLRHLTAYYEGETIDPDSGENHLSHVMANCMVMLDAALAGKLIDDRDEAETK